MGLSRRTGFSILLLTLPAVTGILVAACGIKKPQAPSWYSDWTLPLVNRHIDMAEILSHFDGSNVCYDSAGNPGINIIQPIDTVSLDDQLTVDSAELYLKDSLGLIEIVPPSGTQGTIALDQIAQPNLGYVPPSGFELSQALQPFDRFDWATVDSGLLNITLFNALEIDLDTLILTIIDAGDSHVIGTAVFAGGLDYLETETSDIDLAGQTISNAIVLSYHGHTPGGPLLNISGQYLRATVSFSQTLTVSAARGEVPRITRTKSDTYRIEDSTVVELAIISDGVLIFDVANETDLPCSVVVRSPNFRLNGTDFSLSEQLSSHDYRIFAVDISGYTFIPQGAQAPQQVEVEMINTIPASAPARHEFHAADSLSLHLDVSNISFESLTGRIKPTPVDIDPVTRSMDLPEGFEQSRLTDATLDISIANNSCVPASLDLDVTAGEEVIHLSGMVAPKPSIDSPPMTTVFSATHDQTREFFDPPPDQIVISGGGVINPAYQLASLSSGDYIAGELTIESPFAIALDDTIEFSPEVSTVAIEDSRPHDFGDKVYGGDLRAILENGLPLGTRIALYIGNRADSTLYTDTSSLVMGPYAMGPAIIGPSGEAIQPVTSMISDTIGESHLWLFDGDSVFVGQVIEMFPTDTSGIIINGSDYIGIRAIASLRIRIGD
ncbi:MAG: hypothetical protein A2W25_07525 [candidate division Zixibacteria bacterium RBG_16_53_22]|nr:MAG: hypothetical protein A2W25_07525 [candidate division Zixibacteria bacterium RBG_16_53_22]